MRTPVPAILACCALAAGCGSGDVERHGRFAVASLHVAGDAAATHTMLQDAVRRHGPVAAVFLNGVAMPADRAGAGHVVAIAPRPANEADFGVADTIVVEETGATAALDLAVLASHGVALPDRVALGTRVVSRANVATNGVARAAAGDFVMELLRREHSTHLTARPPADAPLQLGLAQLQPTDPRQERVATELLAAAKKHAWIDLQVRGAAGDPRRLNDIVTTFVREQRRVLVTTDDPAPLAEIRVAAVANDMAILSVDPLLRPGIPITCTVGADPAVMGRAAAEAIARIAPNGGVVIALHGDLANPIVRGRHEGFLAGLGDG